MNHKDQHHEHHRKERDHEKKKKKEHEHQQEKNALPIHPKWLLVIAVVMIIAAVLIWTFLIP